MGWVLIQGRTETQAISMDTRGPLDWADPVELGAEDDGGGYCRGGIPRKLLRRQPESVSSSTILSGLTR
jgi:hypothetical protein